MPTNERFAFDGENKQSTSIERQKITDPFIGPRPFRRDPDDQDRFFGRDRETNEILSLIFAHQLVLLYAQSGAGKTSILNAQVIPTLEKYAYRVLPTARIGIASDTNVGSKKFDNTDSIPSRIRTNFYMFNALQSMIPETEDTSSFMNKSLSEFLDEYFPNKKERGDKLKPRVLVFDQLEEIFRFYPDNTWRQQQEDFFKQVAEALEKDSLLRIIFAIREDYLAELDYFVHILPERLRPRFRLERLGGYAAFRAIKGPLEKTGTNLSHLDGTEEINKQIEELVNDLLKIRVEDPLTGESHEVDGEFVEPIQLQLVCRRWWRKKLSPRKKTDSQNQVELEKSLTDVDMALKEFYEEAVRGAISATGISEDTIRQWFAEKFITASGTRAFVHHRAFIQGISNAKDREKIEQAIDVLEKSYIIRAEWRSGGKWYELTHDRLIKPIKDSNEKWKREQELTIRSIITLSKRRLFNKMKKTFTKRRIAILGGVIFSLAVFAFIFLVLPIYADTPCSKIDTSTLRVGGNPDDIAINPHTNNVYVATTNVGNSSSNIAIVDCGKNSIRGSIHLPNNLHPHLAVNNITNKIYVANAGSNTISVIDGTNLKIIGDVQVGLNPTDVAVNPKTDIIYVANAGSNTISVIDGINLKRIGDVQVDLHPLRLSVNPTTHKIYVANAGSNTVSVIDGYTDKVIKSIPVGKDPSAIFVNQDTNRVYIANKGSNTVSVIDGDKTDRVTNTISVGNGPTDLVADYDQQKNINKIYVANWYSETISVIDGKTNSVINTISMGDVVPVSITVDPESHNLFLNTLDFSYGGTESTINTDSVPSYPKYIQVGDDPKYIAVNPTTHKIYVANAGSNTVSVIDGTTDEVVRNVIGINGRLAVNNQTNKIYVANAGSNTVSVIDGKTDSLLSNEAKVGPHPTDVAVNPKTDIIYVANAGSNTISVIDGSSLKNIKVVSPPEEVQINQFTNLTVNPKINMIIVSSEIRNQFLVINGSTYSIEPSFFSQQQNSTATIFNGGPTSVTFNPKDGVIYAANAFFGRVYVTDENNFPSPISVAKTGGFPSDIAVDTNTNIAYIVNKEYNTVTVLKP